MEATRAIGAKPQCAGGFDPRLRDGGDEAQRALLEGLEVSIHASVMEATIYDSEPIRLRWVSIHASVMEATTTQRP